MLDPKILRHINSDLPHMTEKPLQSIKDNDMNCELMFTQKDNLITENCVAS